MSMPTPIRRRSATRASDPAAADFLALVCHELRTPLQTILGQGELLQREATDEVARGRLAAIGQHGALMLRLVNDLLDWRVIEAGDFQLVARPVDVRALVAQTIESCRPAAEARGLALHCHSAADAPDWARLDGDRVRQVLLNLVGNAIKFTTRGRIEVTLTAGARGRGAVVRVADTGPGIARAEQARIFQPFVRLQRTAAVEGAGLGLALAARLCKRLGGTLTLKSDGRSGATFAARFATPPCAPPAEIVAAAAGALWRGGPVLIADDNPLVRELFVAHLAGLGARCEAVVDGGRALARALAGDFAAVVLDLSMPGLDGFEVTRRLRAQRGAGLRIVGASAHAGATERMRALAAGMDAFLTKPVELGALTAALGQDAPQVGGAAKGKRERETRAALSAQFRREAPAQGAALGEAWRRRDWGELERLAHYVHNSACVVGDEALGAACVRLKQAAVESDEDAAGRGWRRCEVALSRWLAPRVRATGKSGDSLAA